MDKRIEKTGTFILGGLAGAAFGILMAPRSGRELRGAMSSRTGEARQRGKEGFFEARERARERVSGMRGSGVRGMREPRSGVEEEEAILASSGIEPDEEPVDPAAFGPPSLKAVTTDDTDDIGGTGGTGEVPAGESHRESVKEEADDEALRRRVRQARERLGRRSARGGSDG